MNLKVGDETISTTPKHPFWVEGSGWVDAGEVKAGDEVVLADGERATIVSVIRERLESPLDVYNFEVADFHTYFVASAGVWVHNACRRQKEYAQSAAQYMRLKQDLARREVTSAYKQLRASRGIDLGPVKSKKWGRKLGRHGNLSDWRKMTSKHVRLSNGKTLQAHWFENVRTGQRMGRKPKIQ